MVIGEVIKKHRLIKNITQEEMANALNVTPQAVSRWETGISYPDVAMIPHISKYLDVSADKLLGCEKTVKSTPEEPLNQSQIDSIFDYIPGKIEKPKKVLVVDDSDFMRRMLKDILCKEGHEIYETKDGKECVDFLKNEEVDICILDIAMPVMDGIETLEVIREKYPKLKIVMLSAKCTEENVRKTLDLGADGFVAKPFAAGSIIERMC